MCPEVLKMFPEYIKCFTRYFLKYTKCFLKYTKYFATGVRNNPDWKMITKILVGKYVLLIYNLECFLR